MTTMALPSNLSGEAAVQASLDRSPLAHLRRSPSPVHQEFKASLTESYHDSSAEIREHIRRHSSGVFAMEVDSSCDNLRLHLDNDEEEVPLNDDCPEESVVNCTKSVTLNLSENRTALSLSRDPVLASLPPLTVPPVVESGLAEVTAASTINKNTSSEGTASLLDPPTVKCSMSLITENLPGETIKVKGLLQQQLQLVPEDTGQNCFYEGAGPVSEYLPNYAVDDSAGPDTVDNFDRAATPPLHLMDVILAHKGQTDAPLSLQTNEENSKGPLNNGNGGRTEKTQALDNGSSSCRQSQTRTKVYSAIFGSLEHGSFPEVASFDNNRPFSPHAQKHGDNHRVSAVQSDSPRNVANLTEDFRENDNIKREGTNTEKDASRSELDDASDPQDQMDSTRRRSEGPPTMIAVPHNVMQEKRLQSSILHTRKDNKMSKKVQVDPAPVEIREFVRSETFRPSSDAYTPRLKKAPTYKPAPERESMSTNSMGTISRPNFRDALRRVAMIIQQHIHKIERRFRDATAPSVAASQLFLPSMAEMFHEDEFITPRYRCTMVRVPTSVSRVICVKKKIEVKYSLPTEGEIYEFAHQLFKTVQLSSECSIVCLIYIERLMEAAKVPLLSTTWRPIFMAGLLLASKVWQDLSSWNVEFASVYPQYGLEAINRLELLFLRNCKWDLYISSSLYAKYYFALRSLLEKQDFRRRYNRMVGGVGQVDAKEALKIQQRTEVVKEEALMELSRSM